MNEPLAVREAPASYQVAQEAQGVRLGYKQTEVGVIPEDWGISTLSVLSKVSLQNGVFYKPSLKGVGVKLINVGDLYTRAPIDVNALELFDATEKERERFKVEDGDLFFTRSSIVQSGIAHCNIYCATKHESVVFDSHVIRMRPDAKKVIPSYLYRFCLATAARRYLISHAKTGSMTTIDQGVLSKCPIILPPKAEQEAIAEALSDADALIESLEQLIAKKRHLKQGTMQELLTGKKRLPGFQVKPGYKKTEVGLIPLDWEMKRLGELFEITSSKRVFQSEWKSEGIPFYRARELAVLGENGYVKNELFISKEMYNSFKNINGIPEIGDMLVTGVGTLGKVYVVSDEHEFYFKDGNIIWFQILGNVNSEFLRQLYLTQLITKQINDASAGTTVGTYTITGAKKTKILFPSLEEQVAIATILSDMDTEIAALETRLAKTCELKQGMMHQLLTGAIRLM